MAAVLGINLPNLDTPIGAPFSFKAMKSFMEYLSTYNTATQAVAVNGTLNMQTTGTALAILNGQPTTLAADTTLTIATCTEGTLTDWATATSYAIGDVAGGLKDGLRYVCTEAHTSRDNTSDLYINNEPGSSDNWANYWEQRDHNATNAAGTTMTTLSDQWFLILAKKDGVISVWEAGDEALTSLGVECKIPQFDPKVYVPIGLLHVANGSASDFTIGTTTWATGSVTETYIQLSGPIFPHPDNWDKN